MSASQEPATPPSDPDSPEPRPAAAPPALTAHSSLPRPWLLPFALALITLLVFARVLTCDFVGLDDPYYVTGNPRVLTGLSLKNIAWAFTDRQAYWIPTTWLSLMLDHQLFGLNAAGFHLTNLLLHVANVLLLYFFLKRVTGLPWRSALAAALFALHPLRVESVAWVAERKDVLSAFFGLGALLAYADYAKRSDGPARPTRAGPAYALVMLLLALSLWAKPMLVTFPFLLLLLDVWPLRRTRLAPDHGLPPAPLIRLILEKVPFLALAALFSAVTFRSQANTGAVRDSAAFALATRLPNALISYARYLGKTFWFGSLAVPYPYPGRWPLAAVAGAAALLIVISILVLWRLRRQPFLAVGWFWFLGTLVPVIGVIQSGEQSMADRFTYFPAIGLGIMVAYAIPSAWAALPNPRRVLSIACAAALLTLSAFSVIQIGYWKSSIDLYSHAVNATRDNLVAHLALGAGVVGRAGSEAVPLAAADLAEGGRHFRTAIRISPRDAEGHYRLGHVLMLQKDYRAAAAELEAAVRLLPQWAEPYDDLGLALLNLGQADGASAAFQKALDLNAPGTAQIEANLGTALLLAGNPAGAIVQGRRALLITPNLVRAHMLFGQALASTGRFDDALAELGQAQAQRPDDPTLNALIDRVRAFKNRPSPPP